MKKIVTLLLISFCALISNAGDTNEKGEGKLYKGGGNVTRPNKPSQEFISCEYIAGVLVFDFPESIESVDITIWDQNSSLVSTGSVSNSAPEYEVILNPGMYYIECTCAEHGTFAGVLEIY